ncbi:MAG TPA: phosphopantetheine-binding protein [Thermoanaerobaculia bacterium]|nr:phosphopantetheine-binding protein [Thermoanaerobaculia bacterium]
MSEQSTLRSNLKRLIVESLRLEGLTPEKIADDAPLFGQGLGLDSVDALELVVALEKEYRISIKSHEVDKTIFASVASLADFVARTRAAGSGELSLDAQ